MMNPDPRRNVVPGRRRRRCWRCRGCWDDRVQQDGQGAGGPEQRLELHVRDGGRQGGVGRHEARFQRVADRLIDPGPILGIQRPIRPGRVEVDANIVRLDIDIHHVGRLRRDLIHRRGRTEVPADEFGQAGVCGSGKYRDMMSRWTWTLTRPHRHVNRWRRQLQLSPPLQLARHQRSLVAPTRSGFTTESSAGASGRLWRIGRKVF